MTVSGDTRFDRVSNQLSQNNTISFISEFKGDSVCVVIGSSWPEDEAILIPYINNNASKKLKFIIAPHNINDIQIKNISTKLEVEYVLFSEMEHQNIKDSSVFIVNTIGLLSKIYSYADIAYVGGAMGKTGLHNILEPAVFGIPIVIGKNYDTFPEAKTMIKNGGVISIKDIANLNNELNRLVQSPKERLQMGSINENCIKKNKGAVNQIMDYIRI